MVELKVGYQANAWGGVVGHPVGVTSIKDLFYLTPGDTLNSLGRIAHAGYGGVELFDGNLLEFEDDAGALQSTLEQHELALIGVYSGANFIFGDVLGEELWRIRRAAELGRRFGAEQLVVGGGAQRTQPASDEDYARLAAALDQVADIAEEHGLVATYHPHLSTIVEGPDQVDRVFERTGIGFCPDLGHLVAAGGDAVDLVTRYADRIPYIHFKDVTADGAFVPLGEGVVDFPGVVEALRSARYDGWVTVELDGYDGDPDAAAGQNREYLRELLA
ncbi:MAG: inosose dehydratase [Thermoleophilaceae bacterium]|nr:inosose dehydratase [Thermoleophilaceae bacterium]